MEKIIWMLWFQGFERAPEIVKRCVETWRVHNPGWHLVLLDQANVRDFINVDPVIARNRSIISSQAHANVVRINLLKNYGGVWADTTLFCMQPLDSWIHEATASGFFAYRNPGPDRIMSNWFLSSNKECYLTDTLCEAVNEFWSNRRFVEKPYLLVRQIKAQLVGYTSRRAVLTRIWFLPLVRDIVRIYPYFWFHYLFHHLYITDARFARIWDMTPWHEAMGPLQIHHDTFGKDLNRRSSPFPEEAPFYKLSWRFIEKQGIPVGSPLEMLLKQNRQV